MTAPRKDPLDEVLREAHRRGQVVVMHPVAGAVFVHASIGPSGVVLPQRSADALARLEMARPARPAGEAS